MADRITTFPLAGPINLQARVGHGSLTVLTRDDLAEAVVELVPADPGSDILAHYTVQLQGPTLEVIGPRQGGLMDIIGYKRARQTVAATITVPTRTAMKLETATADIRVNGTSGGAEVTSGTGDISIATVDGDLRLRLGSSDARVNVITGNAQLRAGSGDVTIGEIGADLEWGAGSGDLEVTVVRGSTRSRAGSGDVSLRAIYGDADLFTGSGDMMIGLPAGVSVRLDTMSGSGDVTSDLPIEDAPTQSNRTITVRTRAGSGDVRLFRAA